MFCLLRLLYFTLAISIDITLSSTQLTRLFTPSSHILSSHSIHTHPRIFHPFTLFLHFTYFITSSPYPLTSHPISPHLISSRLVSCRVVSSRASLVGLAVIVNSSPNHRHHNTTQHNTTFSSSPPMTLVNLTDSARA